MFLFVCLCFFFFFFFFFFCCCCFFGQNLLDFVRSWFADIYDTIIPSYNRPYNMSCFVTSLQNAIYTERRLRLAVIFAKSDQNLRQINLRLIHLHFAGWLFSVQVSFLSLNLALWGNCYHTRGIITTNSGINKTSFAQNHLSTASDCSQ